jgi:hypothetical protein
MQEFQLLSRYSMSMQIVQFTAISGSIQVYLMEVIRNWKSNICTQLQLMQEFQLVGNHSFEIDTRKRGL